MARSMSREEADEVVELWGRLDRLKIGIGGWVVTAAALDPADADAIQDANDHIRDLTDHALAVRERIGRLTQPAPRHPLNPPASVASVPVVDLPDMIVRPGSQVARVLHQQAQRRALREEAAHRAS